MFTLHQLKRRGRVLANRCYLYEEDEETIEQLLVHYKKVRMLWDLFLEIVGTSRVFSEFGPSHSSILARRMAAAPGPPPFAYFGLYGWKGIGSCLRMVLPLLKGQQLLS